MERIRSALVLLWPFLASLAAMAVIVVMGVIVLGALDRDEERDRQAAELTALTEQAKAASETNRQILEQIRPCNPKNDPPDAPPCVREAERQRVLADALIAIQVQHDEVLRRLEALLSRPEVAQP